MRIRLQIGYPLEMLPNLDGFRFRGVEQNGDLTSCMVVRQENGLHAVISETDGSYCFNRLRGWMQWLPTQKTAHGIKGEA